MKKFFSFNSITKFLAEGKSLLFEVIKIAILVAVIVLPVRYFLFQPFFVQGISMEPNFENGDYLIIDEISYRFTEPERGEIIVFKYPKNPSQRYIKRIIGLPGETVEIKDGKIIIINGKESQILNESKYLPQNIETSGNIRVSLSENEYFVLGDNRDFSLDSRRWGVLPKQYIIGKVYFRAWPFTTLAKFEAPAY
ncbi:MAG: signal peptidase I [Candidatus Nealsonbacteria bacterium]|nr:MAG: signal peptidase I [Candidatus Nealsonbacteria bacterium]